MFHFFNILFFVMLTSSLHGLMTWEEAQAKVATLERHVYPYHQWMDDLEQSGVKTVSLFAYGSLMDRTSAARTISEASLNTLKYSLAFGVKRIFDLDVPIKETSRWPKPFDANARGMLNLQLAQDYHFVNGVTFQVTLEDLRALMKREEGYDLMPLVVADWEVLQTSDRAYDTAYAFHAPQDSHYTSESIFPRPRYYELTRDAARKVSPFYGHLWLLTTYMADGRPITEWEKALNLKAVETQVICSDIP